MSVPYPMPGTEKEGLYPSFPSAPLENPPPYTPTPDRNEIEEELHKIEDEISTLKAVLISKQERAAQLKRQLGMYGFDVAKDDMKRAAQSIANSKPYTTVKGAVTKQWNNVTNTNAYKSVNNSVSSFFKSVKSSFSGDLSASTPGSAKQAQSRASVPSSSTTHLTQPI
ncbi:tumor protein d52 [Echinococcus multilocularis]|uniref:Tumor protein d52 n=1 Tax=Echinococcus multilocularis TaxID=6211 RepID=A0A068Y339_ECHMU|nr:tumor protein d52 [Echinococcus multilocularis]